MLEPRDFHQDRSFKHEYDQAQGQSCFASLTSVVTTIVTDFMIALLPIPLVWQLQLNLRSKISLMFVLTLGIFAAIAAIVKGEIQKTVLQDPDPFVHDRFTLWRFIELDSGLIAASLPACKPLFNWCLGAARGLTSRAQKGNTSLGYRKQSERSGRGIALELCECDPANSVRISSRRPNGSHWTVGLAQDSDENILPLHNVEEKPGTIIVKKDILVS